MKSIYGSKLLSTKNKSEIDKMEESLYREVQTFFDSKNNQNSTCDDFLNSKNSIDTDEIPDSNDDNIACEWDPSAPRIVIDAPGCTKTASAQKICSGRVVCVPNTDGASPSSPSDSMIKIAACDVKFCDEGKALKCVKDTSHTIETFKSFEKTKKEMPSKPQAPSEKSAEKQ